MLESAKDSSWVSEGVYLTTESTFPTVARLLRLHEDVEQFEYWLETGLCRVGRHPTRCAIVIHSRRKTVSLEHAIIERRDAEFVLRDTASLNGTFVDGVRIHSEHLLRHGQEIGFASAEPLLLFAWLEETIVADQSANITNPTALRYDAQWRMFYFNDQRLHLPPTLFRLLEYLHRRKGQICSREELAEAIWQDTYLPEYAGDNLDKLLGKLRGKLRQVDPQAELIQLRRGFGYILDC